MKRLTHGRAMGIVFAVSCAVYAGALGNDFVFDDHFLIVNNESIKDLGQVPTILTSDISGVGGESTNYYRPVMYLFYMADYFIFGLKPWGFHLSFILFHGLVSMAVYTLAKELTTDAEESPAIPLGAALLFAVHPVHTQVVAWNGIHEMAMTFFFIAAFILHMRGKTALACVAFFLSALSKETAVALPVVIFAFDVLYGRVTLLPVDVKTLSRLARSYIPYIGVGLAYLAIRSYAIGGVGTVNARPDLTVLDALINALPLFTMYLYKLAVPINLSIAYPFEPVSSLLDARLLTGAAILAAYIFAVCQFVKRNKLHALLLLWMAIPLLPVLYIPALGIYVFAENYLYLPSVAFCLLASLALYRVSSLISGGMEIKKTATIFLAAILTIAAPYSYGTIDRSKVWRDDFTLWSDAVKKAPGDYFARGSLALALHNMGRLDEAIEGYKEALRLNPAAHLVRNNLGKAYGEKGLYENAIDEFERAIGFNPDFTDAHYNLGFTFYKTGAYDKAFEEFTAVLRLDPTDKSAAEFAALIKITRSNP